MTLLLAAVAVAVEAREIFPLNEGWRFYFKSENTSDNARHVTLPHSWNTDPQSEGSWLETTGNYRNDIYIPAGWTSRRLFLKFYGVQSVADLFVNGNHVGTHRGGAAAFTFEITDYVQYGADNALLVVVSNGTRNDVLPTSTDMNLYGGIYRDVELIVTGPTAVSPLYFGSEGVLIRSREVSLTLFYQQLAQCKAIYDKNAETILGNMDSVVFLGGRESSTIKEISENWLGKATISMQTDGRTRGQSESYSQNNQRLGRELMTPSELATMPGDRCILQLRGLPPFYSKKYDLKQHPNYKYTAEADKQKNAFSLDKLINRRRRPGLAEECEVYEATVPDEALTDEDEDILNYDDLDDPDAFV